MSCSAIIPTKNTGTALQSLLKNCASIPLATHLFAGSGLKQIPQLGIHSYQLSNVCVAYRRSAWESVSGFDYPLLTNKDMLIVRKFLDAGWALAYYGNAQVWHSHSFTRCQEFLRNRLIGSVLE